MLSLPQTQSPKNQASTASDLAAAVFGVTVEAVTPKPSEPSKPTEPATEFNRLFRKTFGPLRSYIARLTGSFDNAQDIAQSAYSRVYTVMNDQGVKHPQALLYKTARNLAIDDIRHRVRSPFDTRSPAEGEAVSAAPSTERIVMAREELTLLEHAIRELPEEFRQVVTLRMAESLTHDEVGLRLGLTRKQAEKRLHKAMRLLHSALHASPGNKPEEI